MNERVLRVVSPTVRAHVLNGRFFPAPTSIAQAFVQFAASGDLATNTFATLQRVVVGFVLGAVPGIALGLVAGTSRMARAAIDPVVTCSPPRRT